MSRIAEAVRERRAAKGAAAFIAYLTGRRPDAARDGRRSPGRSTAPGADILELGVPFSDPIADGPVLQRAAGRALAAGTTLARVFAIARRIRDETDLALVLFSYVNPLLRRGHRARRGQARARRIRRRPPDGRPAGGGAGFQPAHSGRRVSTRSFSSRRRRPPSRCARPRDCRAGFLYVVSRTGTTGERKRFARICPRRSRRARRAAGKLPVAVGFGISTAAGGAAGGARSRTASSSDRRSSRGRTRPAADRDRDVGACLRAFVRACRR